jgi:hypothetical protein
LTGPGAGKCQPRQPTRSVSTLVDSRDGRKRVSLGVLALIVLGLTLGATGHVAVHAKRIEVAIALGKEERTFRELTEERRHLEIEIGMLKDPARIIAIAGDGPPIPPPLPSDIRALSRPSGPAPRDVPRASPQVGGKGPGKGATLR